MSIAAASLDFSQLSLEEKVAQLFMVGYSGAAPNAITRRFLERGLGGLIFFRDNFDELPSLSAPAVHQLLQDLDAAVPPHLPRPLIGIDQEGGQVERLPHNVFPTSLTPMAVAQSAAPQRLARDMYGLMASHLRQLGFNLDFFPTLDVNLNPQNPIIGVRSFGSDPTTVWQLGQIALDVFKTHGLIAVGKHFPGHGNGTVDSHLDLPTLHFTEEELMPFRQAIQAGIPAMLVAHGYYPALQTTDAEKSLPSSASPAIIQGLLREKLGFDGVLFTDDMCMGAITRYRSPVEAALACLKAGVDVLLYKQSTEDEWAVYEAVVEAFENGTLPAGQLEASLGRIARLKVGLLQTPAPAFQAENFTPPACQKTAERFALQGINRVSGELPLPLDPNAPLLLIHPDRTRMGNYAFDVPTSPPLDTVFKQEGFASLSSVSYPPKEAFDAEALAASISATPAVICLIAFNALLAPDQLRLYNLMKARFPATSIILASAGSVDDARVLSAPDLHLSLCSYRPASMRMLAQVLRQGLVE